MSISAFRGLKLLDAECQNQRHDKIKKVRTVITGGAGFIGSHAVDFFLEAGDDVFVIDNFSSGRRENLAHCRSRITVIESDLSDSQGAWKNCIRPSDRVVHLAALADIVPSIQDPSAYYRSNVEGTFQLVEHCRQVGVHRFVYAASSSCYGLPQVFPTPETAPLSPQYPYALTKLMGEQLVLHWAKVYQLPAVSLRFFNVYGPRSRTNGTYGAVFGVFLAQKIAGRPFTVVGDGTQTRDFTYVTDVVRAIAAALTSSVVGKVYNVGSGKTVSINRITELLGGERILIPKRPGEPDCTFADHSAITRDLGWEPQISIEEGVSRLLERISDWNEARVWEPHAIAVETADWFRHLGGAPS